MGRKKQKKRDRNQVQAAKSAVAVAVATDPKGGQHSCDDGASKQDIPHFASSEKISDGKGRSDEYSAIDKSNSNCDQFSHSSSVQSSWFPKVEWVSRRHDNELQKSEPTSSVPTKFNKSVKLKSQETDLPTVTSKQGTESTSRPTDKSHSSLLMELNQLKEQLMPAAKACANAINNNCTTNQKNTTPEYEFRQARSICNPYESLGETFSRNHSNRGSKKKLSNNNNKRQKRNHRQFSSSGLSQFVNRSAIKLANIDALLGFILTSSMHCNDDSDNDESGSERRTNNFFFVDLCGAPGGFSEYILYRHVHPVGNLSINLKICDDGPAQKGNHECSENDSDMQSCYGFGMSLMGSNDDGKGARWALDHLKQYHLHNSNNNTSSEDTRNNNLKTKNEKLHYHVCNGADGTGSIYNWDNVLRLQREMSETLPPGNHDGGKPVLPLADIVVADGGFDAQRDSDNQEAIAHKIIVSQTAAALTVLRPGGTFVLKMFGFREDATKRMLRYLYECFDGMTFVKPILSRPASAERYLVCHGYAGFGKDWDGIVWRERMLMTTTSSMPASSSHPDDDGEETTGAHHWKKKKTSLSLEDLMDSFDVEMLQLNIDTCQSIIDHLDEKKGAAEEEDGDMISVYRKQRKYFLDPKEYEAAWQLI